VIYEVLDPSVIVDRGADGALLSLTLYDASLVSAHMQGGKSLSSDLRERRVEVRAEMDRYTPKPPHLASRQRADISLCMYSAQVLRRPSI
jgi:hypothetical protein